MKSRRIDRVDDFFAVTGRVALGTGGTGGTGAIGATITPDRGYLAGL